MSTVAIAIVCKVPIAGITKTRLSPPLPPDECAAISACFIRDIARTVQCLADEGDASGYALYTPVGAELALRPLLPSAFRSLPQTEGDLGTRLFNGTIALLEAGHSGVVLVNSDSPTLPKTILRNAVDSVRQGDSVVLSPAFDGGYILIGLSHPHARLFEDIPWSTDAVYSLTAQRARDINLPIVTVPGWYDVDNAQSLRMLENELRGRRPGFAEIDGSDAPATRQFLRERRTLSA